MSTARRIEVVVAGAGPAGLQAAIAAAEGGVRVAVFDQKTVIGVPVRCGEFFPSKEEMLNLLPRSRDFASLFEIPSNAVNNECDTLRMYSPTGKCWEFPFSAYILDRTTLEQNMAREAEALGAEFRLGCAVEAFTSNGRLRVGPTFSESIETSVLVAADGFPSKAVSSGGLADPRYGLPENVAVNYQYVMDNLNVESNVTEMYMGSAIAPGGYAWIIPKSNSTANVGVGVRTTFTRSGRGRDYLDHFVREYSLTGTKLASGKIQSMIADVLPVDGAASRTQSDRILVAGDSAGMVMPTNGGGIPTAMVSGRIAGEVAALHVLRGEPLSSYETRWMNAIGHELHASTRMRRFADIFMRHDTLFDLTMRVLRTGGIKKVVTCKIPTGLDTLMRLCGY